MRKNIILFIVSFAMFMESVDTTIINTAIPVMAKSFHVNPLDLKLALISYLLSLAIFIPISGWMADKFGIKTVFISAITVFTLSSAWCGLTENLWELIAARIAQGIGGSLTIPVGRLIILRVCERHELISKMSIVIMVASIGMMLGPLLGGFIVAHASWRAIFWVNIPVGILAVLLSMKLLPAMPPVSVPPLDKLGFVLFGSGLATLTYGLSTFSESEVLWSHSVLIILLAILLLVCYTRHSRKKEHPIVKVGLLSIRTFQTSVIGNFLGRLSFGGVPFLLPLLLQVILERSPELSGMLLTPIALGVLTAKPCSIHILRFFGYKKFLIFNTLLVGTSLWSFSMISQNTAVSSIGLLTYMYGFAIALQFTGMNSLAYANIHDDSASAATSMMSTIQQLSQSFGVAIAAIIISCLTYEASGMRILTLNVFHQTFMILSILTLLSGLIFFRLDQKDGSELLVLK